MVVNERNMDIVKGHQFREANINFESMLTRLKRKGLEETVHYPAIRDSDIENIYASKLTSLETPTGLFNKVQFDIRLYFFRRGAENMHSMKKILFKYAKILKQVSNMSST